MEELKLSIEKHFLILLNVVSSRITRKKREKDKVKWVIVKQKRVVL